MDGRQAGSRGVLPAPPLSPSSSSQSRWSFSHGQAVEPYVTCFSSIQLLSHYTHKQRKFWRPRTNDYAELVAWKFAPRGGTASIGFPRRATLLTQTECSPSTYFPKSLVVVMVGSTDGRMARQNEIGSCSSWRKKNFMCDTWDVRCWSNAHE